MIIGGSKKEVINNIKNNIKNNELNKKVEVGDPVLTNEELNNILNNFFDIRKNKIKFFLKSRKAFLTVKSYSKMLDKNIVVEGIENLEGINAGAIVTSNHFNPLDNLIVRQVIKQRYKKEPHIVIQDTNLAMDGLIGYLMNYYNTIPISKGPNYIINCFKPYLKKILDKKNYVLIYPEEEMWFNYRKPRPTRPGAYRFACENNKPIISLFVEIIDTDKKDNEEFNEVKYKVHILKPIYTDSNLSIKENARVMALRDYEQKKEAYEKAYNKKLDYTFDYSDIAGYRNKD